MRGNFHKERRASSSAGVSRSKLASEARKKKLGDSSSTSESLKSVFAEASSLDGVGLTRKWSRQDEDAAGEEGGESLEYGGMMAMGDGDVGNEDEQDGDGKKGKSKSDSGKGGKKAAAAALDSVPASSFDEESILDSIASSHSDDRKDGLALLLKVIRSGMAVEVRECILTAMLDPLKGSLCRSINRLHTEEQEDEATLTMHLVCLLGLLVGPDEDDFFKAFEAPLKKIVECSSVGEEVQNLALFTLSFISYICSSDTLVNTLDFVEDLIENGPHEITDLPYIQACKSWVLLCGALEQETYIIRRGRSGIFSAVSSILENSLDTEGRTVSGLCLAYLYEVAIDFHRHVHDTRDPAAVLEGTEEVSPERPNGSGTAKDEDSLHDGFDSDEEEDREADHRTLIAAMSVSKEAIEEDPSVAIGKIVCENDGLVCRTLTTLRGITRDSSKKMSKKDKKEQRAVFRDIESLIFDMTAPKEKVRFSGATVEVCSIQALTFLESLRAILGNGFQGGLRSFPVLCDIFNVQRLDLLDEEAAKNKGAKVAKGSKEDKRRFKHRREGQNAKS